MYCINKIVMGMMNPMTVGLLLLGGAFFLVWFGWRRLSLWFAGAAFAWLAVWSSPLLMPDVSRRLERMYPPVAAETLPTADAIVLLGGGMSKDPDGESVYPEMHEAADRVWHAARLWKAKKAPVIFTSGTNEAFSSVVLLRDLGVPDSAIVRESASRNTEENATFVARMLPHRTASKRPKVLLVTSAWHMRRALLMFRKYAPELEVIPAACDYVSMCHDDAVTFESIFPSSDVMSDRTRSLKELLGYWGYRLLRK